MGVTEKRRLLLRPLGRLSTCAEAIRVLVDTVYRDPSEPGAVEIEIANLGVPSQDNRIAMRVSAAPNPARNV